MVNTDDSQGDWLVMQAISNGNLDAADNTINLSALNKRLYIMNVTIQEQVQAFRIIKQ